MTHTLHREGNPEDLSSDFPVLAIRAKGYNEKGNLWRLKKILEVAVTRYPLANFGDIVTGTKFTSDLEQMKKSERECPIVHMVFTNRDDLTRFLEDLKEMNLGISVVVSGLFETIFDCCRKVGLKPHTVNYSAGVWGRVERLPPSEILEVTTLCGHSLVSSHLVRRFIEEIGKGKIRCEEAAQELARQCVCGIFNPIRAASILRSICRLQHSPDEGPSQE